MIQGTEKTSFVPLCMMVQNFINLILYKNWGKLSILRLFQKFCLVLKFLNYLYWKDPIISQKFYLFCLENQTDSFQDILIYKLQAYQGTLEDDTPFKIKKIKHKKPSKIQWILKCNQVKMYFTVFRINLSMFGFIRKSIYFFFALFVGFLKT